ncbi:hypothetical protein [Liquorilactobacillus hordei]|uniref:Uncharacterized protein n=1 Tax=Liquorilactobacillus hordei DSM 19519 TaxID=1423759 RepID=A0A0R1MWC4_9LACO|nr:hypothetical protein [Liquorilactobacillus hordei]KRL07912.1 hypothetical protein FC92_GL000979 [Liquorilactobacillus hordei DSM 19519]QYH50994.1 hypothetical protein G6O70_00065 [Liquorilactobacillus hordei DSM 19519]QYH51141.1 hypothetical protein G6O70_00860 [Liquorilactobacillus hordei DSM 19519]
MENTYDSLDSRYRELINNNKNMTQEQKEEQYSLLNRTKKTEEDNKEKYRNFGKIPNSLLDNEDITYQEIALYTYLTAMAHGWIVYDFNAQFLSKKLNIGRKGLQQIENAISGLVEKGFINTRYSWGEKTKYYDVTLSDYNANFSKIYCNDILNIIKKSSSIKTLSILASYAAIRSYIFDGGIESQNSTSVCYSSHEDITERAHISYSALNKSVDFLSENKLLATIKVNLADRGGIKKIYYSHYKDRNKLEDFVKNSWLDGRINRIVYGVIM